MTFTAVILVLTVAFGMYLTAIILFCKGIRLGEARRPKP